MKNYCLYLVLLFAFVNIMKAQTPTGKYSDYFREGNFLIDDENYDLALKNFLQAYKLDSSSANICFNVGYCYLNSSFQKGKAEYYLSRAMSDISKKYIYDSPSEKSAPVISHFYYARALHINYKFDEALAQYDIFEKNFVKNKELKDEVAYYKAQTIYAKELVASPINVQIENLGDSVNSSFPDYSPVLSADETTLIFTTRRNTSTGGSKTPDGQFYEDIVVSYKDGNGKWSSPKSLGQFINTNGHEASINLTPDGQTLIVFRSVTETDGNIYYSSWNGKEWGTLQSFGSDINSKYWEPHACLSPDNSTLYFVSNRPGGYGGRDIYRCVKLPNGTWSKAMNLGPVINTKYDEDGPFIHPDGVTLIFASKGHKTMGGFDLFATIINEDKKFTEPQNMGYPINTPDDDVFFVTSPDGKRGYFSSAKDGGHGEKDIYKMFIPEAKEKLLALFKGTIIPAEGEKLPDILEVIVTNKETGEIVGIYKPKENGTFATILAPDKNYNFSYQVNGEEFYNEDLHVSKEVAYQEINKEVNLDPIALLGSIKTKKGIVLNVLVLNNKKDQIPVPNAKVILTEKGGSSISFEVDANGKKDGTSLSMDKTYALKAEATSKTSKLLSFNTNGLKGNKSITQILYVNDDSETEKDDNNKPDVACGSPVEFKQNFGYNKDEIDEAKDWEILIDAIVSKTRQCSPTIKIMSSASQVPTKLFGGNNKKLAESRVDKMEEKIKVAVNAKGGDASKIIFKKRAAIRGPVYEADFQNAKKYNPYQYVRVIAR